MAKNWDAEMQERFEKLAKTVDEFGTRFDAIDKRFDVVDKRLDGIHQRLDGVDKRLDGIDRRFGVVDKRFDDMARQMESTEERILNAFKIEGERVRTAVERAAEGYGATLERMERTLEDSRRECHNNFTVHDRALKNHAKRITALERANKP